MATDPQAAGQENQTPGPEPATQDEGSPATGAELVAQPQPDDLREEVEHPTRLLRIAGTVQALIHEVETTDLDEAARQRLTDIHNRVVADLRDLLSDDLGAELEPLTLESDDGPPSGAELRVMQAQLSGWLQGLFHGIQASVANQQLAAQQQLAQMRQQLAGEGQQRGGTGQYL